MSGLLAKLVCLFLRLMALGESGEGNDPSKQQGSRDSGDGATGNKNDKSGDSTSQQPPRKSKGKEPLIETPGRKKHTTGMFAPRGGPVIRERSTPLYISSDSDDSEDMERSSSQHKRLDVSAGQDYGSTSHAGASFLDAQSSMPQNPSSFEDYAQAKEDLAYVLECSLESILTTQLETLRKAIAAILSFEYVPPRDRTPIANFSDHLPCILHDYQVVKNFQSTYDDTRKTYNALLASLAVKDRLLRDIGHNSYALKNRIDEQYRQAMTRKAKNDIKAEAKKQLQDLSSFKDEIARIWKKEAATAEELKATMTRMANMKDGIEALMTGIQRHIEALKTAVMDLFGKGFEFIELAIELAKLAPTVSSDKESPDQSVSVTTGDGMDDSDSD